jgi:peptide/nickel transport system substrate-binding protein
MFSYLRAFPLPRHLLERPYLEDPASLALSPYWGAEFVGTGPFKLREWTRGSHAILEANDQYPLGRPRVDEVEVRFIPDASTLMANVLANAVELTLGRGLAMEQGMQLRDQWSGGHLEIRYRNWVVAFPQLLTPSPAAIGEVRFRRALTQAIDRQEIADTLQAGLVPIAHSYVGPNEPGYQEIESSIVRYDYDPRAAAQLLEGMGFARGADGGWRDGAGQRLAIEVRQAGVEISRKSMLAVAGYWQRFGIETEPVVIPPQRAQDREYRATFPGYEVVQQPNDLDVLGEFLHSSQAPTPENNFRAPSPRNRSRYQNPEYDALLDRYLATIPPAERLPVLGQIMHHLTDRALVTGLVYSGEPLMIGHRLRNVAAVKASNATPVWNAHLWEVSG